MIDLLGKSPRGVLESFLETKKADNYARCYLLTPIEQRDEKYDLFREKEISRDIDYLSWEITDSDNPNIYGVRLSYQKKDQPIMTTPVMQWTVNKENQAFKVFEPDLE